MFKQQELDCYERYLQMLIMSNQWKHELKRVKTPDFMIILRVLLFFGPLCIINNVDALFIP